MQISCCLLIIDIVPLRFGGRQRRKSQLCSSDLQTLPVHTWEDVVDEGGIEIDFLLLELGILEVEGVGLRGGLARFDGAGKEVDC